MMSVPISTNSSSGDDFGNENGKICENYIRQTCGTPSVWHPSEFVDEDGQIQLHPNHTFEFPAKTRTRRAINGFEPNEHSMPWNVYVVIHQRLNGRYGSRICGGTLIDENTGELSKIIFYKTNKMQF